MISLNDHCGFKGEKAWLCASPLRYVQGLQPGLLKPHLDICRAGKVKAFSGFSPQPDLRNKNLVCTIPQAISVFMHFNFFLKLWLFTRHSLPSALIFCLSASYFLFPERMSIYTHTLWHEGTCGRSITQIRTIDCRLFNYKSSYFSKDYLGFFLGGCLFLCTIIAGKRVKWQCIKNF